jgi:hypothetical protein
MTSSPERTTKKTAVPSIVGASPLLRNILPLLIFLAHSVHVTIYIDLMLTVPDKIDDEGKGKVAPVLI